MMKNMYLTFKIFLLGLVLCLMSTAGFAENKHYDSAYERVMDTGVLRCGYFVWAPQYVIDPISLQRSGVAYDLLQQLAKTLNIKIEWSYEYTLGLQVEAIKSSKIDAICIDTNLTRSALPYLDYSEPFFFLPGYLYALKTNNKVTDVNSLNSPNVSFATIDGDGTIDYIQMNFPLAKIYSLPSTTDSALFGQNILTGKADIMFNDPYSIEAYPKEDQDKLRLINANKPLAVFPFFMSVQKGDEKLLRMLNQGIELMNDTGMIDQILDRYDPSGKKLLRPQKRYR